VPLNDAIRQSYLDWLLTQSGRAAAAAKTATGLLRHRVLWQGQAPGTTCLSALHAGGLGSVEKPINDRQGCGGVMRTAPRGSWRLRSEGCSTVRRGSTWSRRA
jgi:hypothetical protein